LPIATTGDPIPSAEPSPHAIAGASPGVNPDHRQVAVAIGSQDLALALLPVGEVDMHLVAVQVVGVGQDLALLDHDARAAAPSVSNANCRSACC